MTEPETLRPQTHRLLLDVMLGKLTTYLRICGYDAAYAGDREIEADEEIASLAIDEGRTLLTRDVELAKRVDGAVLLTAREIDDQLTELRRAGFELSVADRPSHCGRCNGELVPVSPDSETPEYAPDPSAVECWRCLSCGQLFWNGSHHERMRERLDAAAENGR